MRGWVRYRGQDGYLHELSLTGTDWSHKRWGDTNGRVTKNPSITRPGTNSDYRIAYRRNDGHVMALSWTGTEDLHDVSADTSVQETGSPLAHITIRSTDDHLVELAKTSSGWVAADWNASYSSNTPAVKSNIAAAPYKKNGFTITRYYTLTSTGHIYESSYEASSGGSSTYGTDITQAASAPTATSELSAVHIPGTADTRDVFYIASDQHVHELSTTMDKTGWTDTDLWSAAGIP